MPRVAILNEFGQVEIFCNGGGYTSCTRNFTLINISYTDFGNTDLKPPCSWLDLPQDITATILHKLGPVEIIRTAQLVCSQWWSVCRDPSMWRCIKLSQREEGYSRSQKICKYVVDRSQGQLIDVTIDFYHYCYDELLLYISQRSSSLRRLQLIHPGYLSSKGIIEAVKNLPLLEELHLYHNDDDMDAEAIEAIGRSCPLLKSFKLNMYYKWRSYEREYDLLARAIAKYMPALRHLQQIGNRMTNEGVLAILNGCSHVESLDLRQCFNVRFGGDIEILSLQSHDPTDDYPTDDYPFDVQSDDGYWSDVVYWRDDNYWMDELYEMQEYHQYMLEEQNELAYDDIFELHKTPSRKKIKGIRKKIKAKKMKDANSQWPVSILNSEISDSEREILTPSRKKTKRHNEKNKSQKDKRRQVKMACFHFENQ